MDNQAGMDSLKRESGKRESRKKKSGTSIQRESDKWFVEEFHLRSPVEEFEEHARLELERILDTHHPQETSYRKAVDLVIARLRGEEGERP